MEQRGLYEFPGRLPTRCGALDRRLGTTERGTVCDTCGGKLADCIGHWASIRLVLPVFHFGFFKHTLTVLQSICKECSRVLIEPSERSKLLRDIRRSRASAPAHALKISRNICDRAKKISICPYCKSHNGIVKKSNPLRITHDKFRSKSSQDSDEYHTFQRKMRTAAAEGSSEIGIHAKQAVDHITPLRALILLQNMPQEDVELLNMDTRLGRPERMIMTHVAVPPACLRPSVLMDGSGGSTEDDLTMKLSDIAGFNSLLRQNIEKGLTIQTILDQWDILQIHCAQFLNSELPGVSIASRSDAPRRITRGLVQRLKGKQGRFRGNLSGKRVDHTSRTVISPDPNLAIDEVGVPVYVARALSVPDRAFSGNIAKLKAMIRRGPKDHPGANYVIKSDGSRNNLAFGNRDNVAGTLRYGDVVERHLIDGDVVLFNRQPSLHRVSIMAHRVRVMPWRTFRMNICVCTPYNADFDGDEMNLHVPQTEEARAEAFAIMRVPANLTTPRNGLSLIGGIQDLISASFLLTNKAIFYDRSSFALIVSYAFDASAKIRLPPPAIVKPVQLWTGKQVMTVMLSDLPININAPNRQFRGISDRYSNTHSMHPEDAYVVFRHGEHLSGQLDKLFVGTATRTSIFHAIMHLYSGCSAEIGANQWSGNEKAAECMARLSKLCSRWLGTHHGLSIGIDDVSPSAAVQLSKRERVDLGNQKVATLTRQLGDGSIDLMPGCSPEQSLESHITGALSAVRQEVGESCINQLRTKNSALVMAVSGSKGSTINISQMVACVGQQTVGGQRMPDGFVDRSLPHFPVNDRSASAKGFVESSFHSGLHPHEFFFHTMGGREGLVDTAVKTAETGYMQRRLMKAMEDLSIQYDGTVRDTARSIYQFRYGADGLDPCKTSGSGRPVHFPTLWQTVLRVVSNDGPPMSADAALALIDRILPEPMSWEAWDAQSSKQEEEIRAQVHNAAMKLRETPPDLRAASIERIRELNKQLNQLRERPVSPFEAKTSYTFTKEARGFICDQIEAHREVSGFVQGMRKSPLEAFVRVCQQAYESAAVSPGEAVGAVGAQSIGEPGTQMTLKTFHFAGVASMNVTQGVPRIREIINASKSISTPFVMARLADGDNEASARVVKARLERTTLGGVSRSISRVVTSDSVFIQILLDLDRVRELYIDISAVSVANNIIAAPKLKIKPSQIYIREPDMILIQPTDTVRCSPDSLTLWLPLMANQLPQVVVSGLDSVHRVVINKGDDNKYFLVVEGQNLRGVMGATGVVGHRTTSNSVMDVEAVLGVEAARQTIVNEIGYTMSQHGIHVDRRHLELLADVMTSRGRVLGIQRFGIGQMKESVLMLASFEKTSDHLFEAAVRGRRDKIEGVSECIILGQPVPIGTGLFTLEHDLTHSKVPDGVGDRMAPDARTHKVEPLLKSFGRPLGTPAKDLKLGATSQSVL